MVDERADDVRIAKIHAKPHAGIAQHPAVVVGDIHGIAQERLVDGKAGPFTQLEVQLVDMEIVQLRRAVLDDPILDVALPRDDIGRVRLRIERLRRFPVGTQKELGRTVRVIRIFRLL